MFLTASLAIISVDRHISVSKYFHCCTDHLIVFAMWHQHELPCRVVSVAVWSDRVCS